MENLPPPNGCFIYMYIELYFVINDSIQENKATKFKLKTKYKQKFIDAFQHLQQADLAQSVQMG